MNLIGCLDTPTKGQYYLNGNLVSEMEDDELARIRNKEIGFVFQTFNLLAPRHRAAQCRTATDLRRHFGRERSEPGARSLAGRRSRTAHASQAERVIGRTKPARRYRSGAWSTSPPFCLPTNPPARSTRTPATKSWALFERLHQQGNTIVLVTHEHDIAMHAHRIIHIRDGKVERDEQVEKT